MSIPNSKTRSKIALNPSRVASASYVVVEGHYTSSFPISKEMLITPFAVFRLLYLDVLYSQISYLLLLSMQEKTGFWQPICGSACFGYLYVSSHVPVLGHSYGRGWQVNLERDLTRTLRCCRCVVLNPEDQWFMCVVVTLVDDPWHGVDITFCATSFSFDSFV